MDSSEYKNIISNKNVLDNTTLNITLKELSAAKETKLVSEIERILSNNKIEKPIHHANPDDKSTDYFYVNLTSEQIETIIDLFLNLEAQYVSEDGTATPTCAFYASLVDRWQALSE